MGMANEPACPWAFLEGLETQNELKVADGGNANIPTAMITRKEPEENTRRVSFADKVRGEQPCHLDLSDLPTPEMKGNIPSIKLPKRALERGMQYCRFSLVRIDEETKKKQMEETIVATNKEGPTKKKRKRSKKNKNKGGEAGTSGAKNMTGNIVETPTVGEGDKVGEPAVVDTAQEAETLVEETQNVVEANIAVEVQSTPPNDEHLNAVALMPLSPALADNSLAATPNDREFGELSISPNLNAPENAVAPQTLLCGNIAMNDASNGSDSPSQRDVVEDSPITPQSSSGNLASHEAQRGFRRSRPTTYFVELHITIQFDKFTVSTVHASTSYVIRRALWHDLTGIGSNVDVWMVIGDFNCITQASERKGGGLPCQRAVNEFVDFMNTNCLLDSTTLGHKYSWSNRRFGHKRMVQKIDRALVNSLWIDANVEMEVQDSHEEVFRSLPHNRLEC
ncbi:hypothetical protein IFM89_039269 [Coptis chinensis]|uniref:Uncharacterized protein n=1 Tax=Coptis chinensis TaxID=261450 RepID=A0A835IHQ0_9MAGN|nr:hypothetical protein IFM89_039269 [Coptis chinensis]